MALKLLVVLSFLNVFVHKEVEGHGYMISPPNRASLWRIDWTQPANYNDNEYFCGGTYVQYYLNEGKCGPCGDNWKDPPPRSNENTGTYGNGIVVSNYTAGSIIEVTSLLTANHMGSLYFYLCELTNPNLPETEDCFQLLRLADGTEAHIVKSTDYTVVSKVKLPDDLSCDRCVLRWHYRTGNSWGKCEDGTQNIGCGDQEIFRSCADVRILPAQQNEDDEPEVPEVPVVPVDPVVPDSDKVPDTPEKPEDPEFSDEHPADCEFPANHHRKPRDLKAKLLKL
ncbi:uncharacterized protein LOC115891457 [Sitophilus oryzae]|uniref:Uncharacterized protein LOC115891457 n=1 Tax=Sitophilus oryzae TaxID=7048 RepID=A0A6J2YX44_SITOR|nr:uncharacterized protein LOC115891457 [Sitophilus oryzae]